MEAVKFVILTGASGAGKTAITRLVASGNRGITCLHFDSIGVPPEATMISEYGSGENWQRVKAGLWLTRVQSEFLEKGSPVLFEGQVRISFLKSAIEVAGIGQHTIVLVDCKDEMREARLCGGRLQPQLANPTMRNWAAFLRKEALSLNTEILDTTTLTVQECAARVEKLFD